MSSVPIPNLDEKQDINNTPLNSKSKDNFNSALNESNKSKIEAERPSLSLTNSKKNLSFDEIYNLMQRMNLDYDKNERLEIIHELGIDTKERIEIDNLIETSKIRRNSSKYADFYDNILNLFITPSERIVKILEDCKAKLAEINQNKLVRDLDWVIKTIHEDDIYNLNLDLMNEINNNLNASENELNGVNENNNESYSSNKGEGEEGSGKQKLKSSNSEMESVMKFLAEFSSDNFTKSKREDVKAAKSLSCKRMQNSNSRRGSASSMSGRINNSRNYSVFTKEPIGIIHNFALTPEFSNKRPVKNSVFGSGGVSGIIGKYPSDFQCSSGIIKKNTQDRKSLTINNLAVGVNKNKFEVIKEEEDMGDRRDTILNEDSQKKLIESSKEFICNSNKSGDEVAIEEEENNNINDEDKQIEEVASDGEKSVKSNHSKNSQESNHSHESNLSKSSHKSKDSSSNKSNNSGSHPNIKLNTLNLMKPVQGIGRMSINLLNNVQMGMKNDIDVNQQIFSMNNSIDSVDFNIFEYSDKFGRENVLINISDYIFEQYSLYCVINSKRFETFLDKIRVGYDYLLPYHNDLHAADVLQTCHLFSVMSNLKDEMDLTTLDLAAFFISAIIHDFKHPGLNNTYQINKRTKIANKYNDISVLENYHLSSAFNVISHPNSNIFCDLSVEEYRVVRKRIVECVLATDMAKHTKSQTSLKIKLDQLKNKTPADKVLFNFIQMANEDTKFDRQQEILNYMIHTADISNPGKQFQIAKQWTDLVVEEFFLQGDLEKKEGLPVSFLCDRNTTNVPKSQIMFITNIILPSFKILTILSPLCSTMVDNLYTNIEMWKKEEEKMQAQANCQNVAVTNNSASKEKEG